MRTRRTPAPAGRRLGLPILATLVLTLIALSAAPSGSATILPFDNLSATMMADRDFAAPGDLVTFTIDVKDIPSSASAVTIDDTVPVDLHVESSTEPSGCTRMNTTWTCNPGGESSISVLLRTRVDEGARGMELVNRAVIDSRSRHRDSELEEDDDEEEAKEDDDEEDEEEGDDEDGGGEYETIDVQASVQVIASDVGIRLIAEQSLARPGTPLNYRIDLVNRGVGPATNGSVVAVLAPGVLPDTVYPTPTTIEGDRLTWSLSQIPLGSQRFLFNASFAPPESVSHVLASASVSYVDSTGGPPRQSESVLSLPVVLGTKTPAFPPALEDGLPLGTIGIMLASAAVGLALVQRYMLSPRPARLRIDQMFLLHRSGLLMEHFSVHQFAGGDPDIQGAMLTAVQSYLETSVDSSAGPLRQITFGGRDIIFANGGSAILAAVVRKGDPSVFFAQAPRFLADLEALGGAALANWDGVADRFDGLDTAFRDFTRELLAHRGT